jgi:serine protease
LLGLASVLAVFGAVLPFGLSAQSAEPFVATGFIRGSQPVFGDSLTEFDFLVSGCDVSAMDLQGFDAYVFELPADFPTGSGAQVIARGDSPIYDLDLAFYGSDCTESGGRLGTDQRDESGPVPANTAFVIVKNFAGVNTTAFLTVQPGTPAPSPSPTQTATPTATPSPTPDLRVRGVYPVLPDDPYFGTPDEDDVTNFTFTPTQWGMRKIQAPQAWQEDRATGFKINVAVVDSGVDLDHPEFLCDDWKLKVDPTAAFAGTEPGPDDENGHGSHVAGIIGACTNNGTGVVGVAPDATIIPVQVLDKDGSGSIASIADGIRRATDLGAHVINMSLSAGIGILPAGGGAVGYLDGFSPEIDSALAYAQSKGVVVVAAAGNDTTLPLCEYPAFYQGVVCVGATDPRDLRSYYSTGPNKPSGEPTIVAPGGTGQVFCDGFAEEILSTWSLENEPHPASGDCENLTGYEAIQGTSMATPHVAGVAALVYDRIGGVRSVENAAKVIEALIGGADDLGLPGADPIFGAGRLNAVGAVTYWPAATDPQP